MDMSRHPSADASHPTEIPAFAGTQQTPDLPALIGALPSDPGSGPGASPRAPQTEFDRARQVLFLENLSVTGSVRSAASAAQVSHQSAYRARRATAAFRTAWDAALVVARTNAADTLAARAIDGIEEKVFYHGEEIATRTRYSDRLLLAHLARLDKLAETPLANALGDAHLRFAEDFDAALEAFGRGEVFAPPAGSDSSPEVPACAATRDSRSPAQAGVRGGSHKADFSFPGPCNTRSMSYTPDAHDWDDHDDDHDDDDDDAIEAESAEIAAAMEAERPADAPRLTGEGPDGEDLDPDGLIAEAQWEAFLRGVPRWWLVVPPLPEPGEAWTYACFEEGSEGDGRDGEDADGEDDELPEEEEDDGELEDFDDEEPAGDEDPDPVLADDATSLAPGPEPASEPERTAPRMKVITLHPPLWINGRFVPQPPTQTWM